MAGFTVRAAQREDIPTLVEMQLVMARETEGIDLDPDTVRRGVTVPFDKENVALYFVAEEAETKAVAGMLMVTFEWSDWRCGTVLWIQSVYTAPAFRRRGVFTLLYEHVKGMAIADASIAGVRLYVEDDNAKARGVYEGLGMEAEHYTMMKWMKGGL